MLAAVEAAASWPPDAAIGLSGCAREGRVKKHDGNDGRRRMAISKAEHRRWQKKGEVRKGRAAAKAAEEWQVARKVEGCEAEG